MDQSAQFAEPESFSQAAAGKAVTISYPRPRPVQPAGAVTVVQGMAIAFVVLLIAFLLEAIRRGRLKERYALLWLGAAGVMLLLAAWRALLDHLARLFGVLYGPSLLFLVAVLFLFAILLHFTLVISEHHDHTRRLSQRVALLAHEVERLRHGGADTPSDPGVPG